jgi:hypothetical protein
MTIGETLKRIIEREREVALLVEGADNCQKINEILEKFRREREDLIWQIAEAKSKDPSEQKIIYNQIFQLFVPCRQTL